MLTSSVVQSRSHRPSARGLVAESGVGLAVTDRGRRGEGRREDGGRRRAKGGYLRRELEGPQWFAIPSHHITHTGRQVVSLPIGSAAEAYTFYISPGLLWIWGVVGEYLAGPVGVDPSQIRALNTL